LNSDQAEKLVNVLGPGANKTTSGKTTIYHAPSMPSSILPNVITISNDFFNAGRNSVNPRGLRAWNFISNVVSEFLKVHSYPAFRIEDPESLTAFEQLIGGESDGKYYPRTWTTKNEKGEEKAGQRDMVPASRTAVEEEKRKRDRSDAMTDDDDEDMPARKRAETATGFTQSSGRDTVVKARPAKHIVDNIGSPANVPKMPGLVFPYFHGLIQPDNAMINSTVLRRFYPLLGRTHEECQKTYVEIRHGINTLSSTSRGMELAHILLGIDLALDTQTRVFLIIEKNQYSGFALLGARFAIFANTRWYAPDTEEEIEDAIRRMDPHESAVDDMTKKLKELTSLDKFTGSTDRSIFEEPWRLAEELAKLKFEDISGEETRELDRCIRSLNYMGSGYLASNPQVIADVLATLASSKDITLDRPTYLPSVKAPFTNRNFKALSRFGPEAPSFWNDRGVEIPCRPTEKSVAGIGGKRKIGAPDVFGNMPGKLLITPKPLLVAVRDMDSVVSKGRVKMDVGERAGRYRNVCVEAEESRKAIWTGLVSLCDVETKKPKTDQDAEDAVSSNDHMAALMELLGN